MRQRLYFSLVAVCLGALLTTKSAAQGAFPPGFKWCVATAAHQIEGDNEGSDWSSFEKQQGRIKGAERSGRASDHWNQLEGDTALLTELGVSQYRFSIEWAKLEPREGAWDEAVAAHYRDELAWLEKAGIAPLVTLMHFTLPQWVADKGGWEWDGIVQAFERHTGLVEARIGPKVRDWVTLNEPTVVLQNGYVSGQFPPGKTDVKALAAPMRNMVKAHAQAYHKLHDQAAARGHEVRVGLAHHLRAFDAYRSYHPLDHLLASMLGNVFNWSFPDAVTTGQLSVHLPMILTVDDEIPEAKNTQDFVGVNYYTRDFIKFVAQGPLFHERPVPEGLPVTDMNWEIYPEGFYRVVTEVAKRYPGKAILITENGIADAKDDKRAKFLTQHLEQLQRAIADGAPVEGYCHWSLIDNFEWAEGFGPRFGFYEVNYETMERTARPSADLFGRITRANKLWPPSANM